ncbi:stalk domain-containing protein [Ammoniphilus sp. 3BR4]|uniref:stalk domain-containing protein n=1 Tax=Ammoniphilus sp. 3BR4 TaxID=3158265 RepID=UPI003467E1AC
MLKISKKVLIGTIAGTLLLGGSAFAKVKYGEKISVNYANIKLIINEKVIETKAEPFIYNKNVYVPIATVANMLGLKQQWYNYDGLTGGTPSVRIYDAKNLMPFIVGTDEYSSTNIGGNLYYHFKKGSRRYT